MLLWFHFIHGGEGKISLDFIRARSNLPVSDLWVWPKGMQLKNTLTQHPGVVKESQPALQTQASIFVLLVLKELTVTNQLFHGLVCFSEGTCISTEVSLVQPRKDGDLRTTENTCSVLCFDLKDSMKGLGCNEDSLRLFAQGPTRSYRKLTESTRKCTKLIWRRTLFLKHLVTAASSQLPL